MSAGSDGVAFVHIGIHKTGTTSFQRWASERSAELASSTGLEYYQGRFGPNHYEIAMLCLRANRNMPMRVQRPDWCLEEWQQEVEAHIRNQVERDAHSLLISAEAMSYLRHADELERLRELLQPRQVVAVAVLRERASFLRSYRQMMSEFGYHPSKHPESFAYVADDTWLVDYDALLGAYREALGAERVLALNYEQVLAQDGSVIPGIVEAMGVDRSRLPSWRDFHRNVTRPGPARRAARRVRRLLP